VVINPLRLKVSNKVLHLRSLKPYINSLLENGFDKSLIDNYLNSEFSKDPKPTNQTTIISDINMMFTMGGVISGGAALSLIKEYPIKDIDFYFNNELDFVKAYLLTFHNPYIDICWYFDQPHELHDMSIVMCNVHPDERIEITPQAQNALDTGVVDIYPKNIIWPERTAKRIMKYNKKYGVKFKKHQILATIGIFKLQEFGSELLEICV
jgi:hypothetical protein